MDTDRAYLLGLIIGGGIFGNAEDVFVLDCRIKSGVLILKTLEEPDKLLEIFSAR